jgi:hypothetical protein
MPPALFAGLIVARPGSAAPSSAGTVGQPLLQDTGRPTDDSAGIVGRG